MQQCDHKPKDCIKFKNIGFSNTAHNYTQKRESTAEYDATLPSTCLFSKVREHLFPLMFMTCLNCTSLHLIYTGCHGACLLYFNLMCLNVTWRVYLTLVTHFNLSGGVCVLSLFYQGKVLSIYFSIHLGCRLWTAPGLNVWVNAVYIPHDDLTTSLKCTSDLHPFPLEPGS